MRQSHLLINKKWYYMRSMSFFILMGKWLLNLGHNNSRFHMFIQIHRRLNRLKLLYLLNERF